MGSSPATTGPKTSIAKIKALAGGKVGTLTGGNNKGK